MWGVKRTQKHKIVQLIEADIYRTVQMFTEFGPQKAFDIFNGFTLEEELKLTAIED